MAVIKISDVSKEYEQGKPVLKNINFEISEGEFVVLLGASGCGKTTMLKMINKLIPVTSGTIEVNHIDIQNWNKIKLRTSIGYVIQQIGLFPHMTIEQNIAYVPRIKKMKKVDYSKKIKELIQLVGLGEADLNRYPYELSGGQKQRIGVARALAADPNIILMDEPFGAVDEITRRHLQGELKKIHQELQKTILFVTHDIEEALKLATKIILFHDGKIDQIGTPDEMVFKPKTEYVKNFFGLKGFKASLNEKELEKAYRAILCNEMKLDEVLQSKYPI